MEESHLYVKSGPNLIAGLKCKVQNNKKSTQNTDKCYVNYESWTRKVIHIFQVDFQQKLSLCFAHIACKINNHLCFQCWCASFYNTFTISDILMRYCFLLCNYMLILSVVCCLGQSWIFYILSKQLKVTHNLFPILL